MPSTSSASNAADVVVRLDDIERTLGELARAGVVGVAEQRHPGERRQRPPLDPAVARRARRLAAPRAISAETVGKSDIRQAARAAR